MFKAEVTLSDGAVQALKELEKPKPFTVTFEYDERLRKWEVYVSGAQSELDALQGFNAVVLTARGAVPKVDHNKVELQSDGRYKVSVGVVG